MTDLRTDLIQVGAWSGFITAVLSPENIALAAGAFSILLSASGIVLNIIKIFKQFKNKNHEKNS